MNPVLRRNQIVHEYETTIHIQADRMFLVLMLSQWALAVMLAIFISPYGWAGKVHAVHQHVRTAVVMGGAICTLPVLLLLSRPGWWGTRQVVAIGQMLFSALLIHLTGGRIETHFHVFVSLAFLAFYRDWRLLITATMVVVADHFARGFLWPESLYGVTSPQWWRVLEHAAWVGFEDVVLVFACIRGARELRLAAEREVVLEELHAGLERRVIERTAQLEASRTQFRALIETVQAVPWELDCSTWTMSYVGPQIEGVLGFRGVDWQDSNFREGKIHELDRERVIASYRAAGETDGTIELEYRLKPQGGQVRTVRDVVTATMRQDGARVVRGLLFDITAQRKLEVDLAQAQKLESVGRLAAGISHEINTPVQYINDSVHFLQGAVDDLIPLLLSSRELHVAVTLRKPLDELAARVTLLSEKADLEFLLENMPKAMTRSIDGLRRVTQIVSAMKEFASADNRGMVSADLNHAIHNTLTVALNRYRYVARVETDFGVLPNVMCHIGEVNQVVLSLISNAAHAIEDVFRITVMQGVIRVVTRHEGDSVVISISDTGAGMSDAVRDRVFEPMFTTKEVGRGIGQGLSLARAVIRDKHRGDLTFETELGVGTTFHVRLPVAQVLSEDSKQAA